MDKEAELLEELMAEILLNQEDELVTVEDSTSEDEEQIYGLILIQ